MKTNIELLDVVAVLNDIPKKNLVKGHIGTVIEVLDKSVFLVEFCDMNGIPFSTAELTAKDVLKLQYDLVEVFV